MQGGTAFQFNHALTRPGRCAAGAQGQRGRQNRVVMPLPRANRPCLRFQMDCSSPKLTTPGPSPRLPQASWPQQPHTTSVLIPRDRRLPCCWILASDRLFLSMNVSAPTVSLLRPYGARRAPYHASTRPVPHADRTFAAALRRPYRTRMAAPAMPLPPAHSHNDTAFRGVERRYSIQRMGATIQCSEEGDDGTAFRGGGAIQRLPSPLL